MKNIIVYRANNNLDKNLLGLREKVDFFLRFEPQELPPLKELDMKRLIRGRLEEVAGEEKELRLFSDITCAPAVQAFSRQEGREFSLICQEEGPLEEWVSAIAEEGKPVIIVRENLADHVNLDGVDPFSLARPERSVGGWYHNKVLSVWENGLARKGASYRVVSATDKIFDSVLEDCVVVCDHHCATEIRERAGQAYRNAYRAGDCTIVAIEDIPVFLKENGKSGNTSEVPE